MKIAFLEDNLAFAQYVITILEEAGHEVAHFIAGRDCLSSITNSQFDIYIFDWQVPDMSGVEVLSSLKLSNDSTPTIFLTGRDTEEDIMQVLESGADDYIVKPPDSNVLVARVNALSGRSHLHKNQEQAVNYGPLTVDFPNRRFEMNGEAVKLTETESEMALCFFKQVGILLSRPHLIKLVWGKTPEIDARTIEAHVNHLRKKLKLFPQFGWRLISVYHHGYRLEKLE